MNVFIYGVPGAGKTHFSKILGKDLGLSVVEADKIKKKARKDKSRKEHPFLYLSTCFAYRQFGDLNKENVIKGLTAVRLALNKAVEEKIKENDNSIIEGAFLDPNSLTKFGRVILLITTDEQQHKKQFQKHREKLFDFKGNEFKSARLIQEFLIDEAKELNIEIIKNTGSS